MNYSEKPGHVRCDRFRASGKWYDTFVIDMSKYYHTPYQPHEAVRIAIEDRFKKLMGKEVDLRQWIFVVLDPYHENSIPIFLFG